MPTCPSARDTLCNPPTPSLEGVTACVVLSWRFPSSISFLNATGISPPYLPVQAQIPLPGGGVFPGVPEPGRDPGGVIPGLPAAPGDAGPSISPPGSQLSRWKDCKSRGSGAKITPKFKFFWRSNCIFLFFERQPPAQMIHKSWENQWFLYDFEHSD